MNYHNFVEKSKMQDTRNIFSSCDALSYHVPEQLKSFFIISNPVDVEVKLEDYSQIKFYPISALEKLQDDYDLPANAFCFATNNSDPIFLKDEKIFTISHDGSDQYELIADSFEKYLDLLISRMV